MRGTSVPEPKFRTLVQLGIELLHNVVAVKRL